MIKKILFVGLVSINVFGQNIIKDSTIIKTKLRAYSFIGKSKNDCFLGSKKYIDNDTDVYVINANVCGEKYIKRNFYEIILDSTFYWVESDYLSIKDTYINSLVNYDNQTLESIKKLTLHYINLEKKQKQLKNEITFIKGQQFIENASTKGIVIYEWGIYDESEYTNGTRFEITLLNPNKKTIKYAWITVSGYNAVNDKVIDPISGLSNKTVKCIGPIKHDDFGSYKFDYFWHTDIVDTAKITNIKIQYMDGTFKNITDPMSLVIDNEYRKLFESDK